MKKFREEIEDVAWTILKWWSCKVLEQSCKAAKLNDNAIKYKCEATKCKARNENGAMKKWKSED